MASDADQLRRDWNGAQQFVAERRKVFVVGCAKSGTTWVMNLLNGHPEMVVNGEGRFTWRMLPYLAQAFKAFNDDQKTCSSDPTTFLRDVDLLMTARMLIDIQLVRYIEESGKPPASVRVVGDKTPQHTQSMPMLAQLYPQAKFIHVVRDPRDAATSGWHHFGPDSKEDRAAYLSYFIREVWPLGVIAARESSRILPGRYMEVRYEDLLSDEAYRVARCLEFLGVDASPEAIAACMKAGDFKERSGGRERGQEDAKNFYRRGVAGDWPNHLTPEAAARMCEPVAGLMRACGYDPLAGVEVGVEVNAAVVDRRAEVEGAAAA